MTATRLAPQVTATTNSHGLVVLTFPPVPAGLVWTGSVSLYTDPSTILALVGAEWSALRNGQPLVCYQGMGILADVQLVGGEVLSLEGTYINPGTQITATWIGQSESINTAVAVSPKVYGSNSPVVQVWNDQTQPIGAPVLVTDARLPNPAVMQSSQQIVTAASTSSHIMGLPTTAYQIWELGLLLTAGQLAAVTGVQWVQASIQTTDASPITLLQAEVTTLPGTADSVYLTVPMHGKTLNAGVQLSLATGAYGGSHLTATAIALYTD